MNRPIKFRAWDKDMERMRTVTALTCRLRRGGGGISGTEYDAFVCDGNEVGVTLLPGEYELMQFTGLHDKNGREIYEGDIIQHSPAAARWVIVYRMGSFCTQNVNADMECYVISGYSSESEVIGNIHENGDILKKEARA